MRRLVPLLLALAFALPAQAQHVLGAPYRVMPIGDSITEGGDGAGGFRRPLFELLTAAYGLPNFVGERNMRQSDPADFADPSKGISGLLLALKTPQKLGDAREGEVVLRRVSGTLSGDLVAPIIPSADPSGTYKTVVGIDEDDRIVTLDVTGEFFSGGGDETYQLAFDDYGKSVKITAP